MAENSKKSFFETFDGGKEAKNATEAVSPSELLKEIEKDEQRKLTEEKNVVASGDPAEKISVETGEEEKKVSVEPVLEVGQSNQELVKKKEYWMKLIESIRTQKMVDDEAENRELQSGAILEEALRVLVEAGEEEIKKGNATETVNLFEKIVLPTIEKEDPGINKDEYLDRLHARLSQIEGIKDLS